MLIKINDDFDLYKIAYSGQCFRVCELSDGVFRFITGDYILYIRRIYDSPTHDYHSESDYYNSCTPDSDYSDLEHFSFLEKQFISSPSTPQDGQVFEISCTQEEWDNVWHHYFDLDTCYRDIRSLIPSTDKYIHNAALIGEGIRILNQDKFEMLISFIISQRKSIPAIKSSVEKICKKYGHIINKPDNNDSDTEPIYSFPTPNELLRATEEELSECGLGYRISYVISATKWTATLNNRHYPGSLNSPTSPKSCCSLNSLTSPESCCSLNSLTSPESCSSLDLLASLSDEELFNTLKSLYGVGDKVANCISLFGYHRTGRAPIDTWIAKVINEEYKGHNPFPNYGPNAGIIQQYVFYYKQHMKL